MKKTISILLRSYRIVGGVQKHLLTDHPTLAVGYFEITEEMVS